MRRAVLLIFMLACDGARDAAPPDAAAGCAAELSGNLVESIAGAALCPTLAPGAGATDGDTLLQVTVPSVALGGELTIVVDLGRTPTPGRYDAGTTALWTAMGVRTVPPGGACYFIAGNNATPTGDFTLDLATLDAAALHGALALELPVLARVGDDGTPTDCGPGTTESIALRF